MSLNFSKLPLLISQRRNSWLRQRSQIVTKDKSQRLYGIVRYKLVYVIICNMFSRRSATVSATVANRQKISQLRGICYNAQVIEGTSNLTYNNRKSLPVKYGSMQLDNQGS